MNLNQNQSIATIIESNSNNYINTVKEAATGTGTATAIVSVPVPTVISVSVSAATAAPTESLKLLSIQDCIYSLKSCKCSPILLKSIYTDILYSAIKSAEFTVLDQLISNNIIQSMIMNTWNINNNNQQIQSKLIEFNEITAKQSEFYRSNYIHFSLLDNNTVSIILQYLEFNEIYKIKSTNKLIYSAAASNSSIVFNQLIINYNPISIKPPINIININTINLNLISHLKFNLILDNLNNINQLYKLIQLKSIELYGNSF